VSRLTQDTDRFITSYVYGPITLYRATFQMLPLIVMSHVSVLQPSNSLNCQNLGYSPFARHYLGNHFCFLFLRLLRCFSSPGLLPLLGNVPSAHWVAPFGNHRINRYLPFPDAYRSLSRPSSPFRAKAFSIRPFLLSLLFHNKYFEFFSSSMSKNLIYIY
jgi:hypothetical protein